jgi:hypothetical protein
METRGDLAKFWLWNFVRVVVVYIALLMLLPTSWYLLSVAFYPEGLKMFTRIDAAGSVTPEQAGVPFPVALCWAFILVNVLGGLAAGFAIVCWSKPSHMLHAIILAIIVFSTHLQSALTPEGVFPKWIMAVLMSTQSIAVLIGGRLAIGRCRSGAIEV